MVESQCVVDRRFDQRTEIEQTRNGVGRHHEIFGYECIERRPVGGQHAGRKMPARRMAAYDQTPPQPGQLARRHPHLPDNVIDGDIWTKVVAWNRDADPMGIQPSGEVAEKRTVQHHPREYHLHEHGQRQEGLLAAV